MAKKKSQAPDSFDTPWKGALQLFLQSFLEFFFKDIAIDIDWLRGYESMEKELNRIARRAKIGNRLADKLFKVWLKNGEEHWLLIHIEVQSDVDKDFARRMFFYNIAALQMYNRDVVSLAVLGDDNRNWRPNIFGFGRWGCKTEVVFRTAKLLDYAGQEETLEAGENPFAAVVLAHAMAIKTRNEPTTRKYWKLRLVQGLYGRNWSKEMIVQLFLVIDYMMSLPEELGREFDAELDAFEKEKSVKYISSYERHAMERGKEEGLEEGLMKGISVVLDVKFGDAGLKLLPKIRSLTSPTELEEFLRFLKEADTLTKVRAYFR